MKPSTFYEKAMIIHGKKTKERTRKASRKNDGNGEAET